MAPQPTVSTASSVRAAQASRARQRRHRNGTTRSTLVDLTALGCFLATLDGDQRRAFATVVGEDVTRRALWAASLVVTAEIERPVAG